MSQKLLHPVIGIEPQGRRQGPGRATGTPRGCPSSSLAALLATGLALGAGPAAAQMKFHDVTEPAGIDATGETYGTSIGDINGDGCPDVWLTNHQYTPTTILINRCDGTGSFDQIDEEPDDTDGGNHLPSFQARTDTHGVGFADFDNDGDQDVIEVSGASWNNLFWVNNGLGEFTNSDAALGFIWPIDPAMCTSERRCRPTGRRAPLWFDYNLDGKLDVMITARGNFIAYQEPTPTFLQTENQDGSPAFVYDGSTGINYQSIDFCAYGMMAELTGDGVMDVICGDDGRIQKVWDISQGVPFLEVGESQLGSDLFSTFPQDLAIGDFTGNLKNDIFGVTGLNAQLVIHQVDERTLHYIHKKGASAPLAGFSFAADGDLFVEFDWWTIPGDIRLGSNAVSPPWSTNAYVHNGEGNRVQLRLSRDNPAHVGEPTFTPGVSPGVFIWYDGAQWQFRTSNVDAFVFDFSGMVVQADESISQLTGVGPIQIGQPTNRVPRLYIQNDDGQFVNTPSKLETTPSSCVAVAAGDFDNDGDLDIMEICSGQVANLPNRVYVNDGNGNFTLLPDAGADPALGFTGAAGQMPHGRGHTVATADFDLDGRLDVFVTNGNPFRPFSYGGRQQLIRNVSDSPNSWVQIDLEGVVSNRDAIGARLFVTTPDGKTQLREQSNGMHKYAQDFKRIHVGLGQNQTFDLEIHWPNGAVETHEDLAANQFYLCVEGGECGFRFGAPQSFISISGVTVEEAAGSVAELTVEVTPANPSGTVTVDFAAVSGTATEGADFVATSGTLTFLPGETAKTISVSIIDDEEVEVEEFFRVLLSNAENAGISVTEATVTVVDNDTIPGPACGMPEFNTATETAVFLWRECGDPQQWRARFTAGGQTVSYRGRIDSDAAFESLVGIAQGGADVLTPAPFDSPTAGPIQFVQHVARTNVDGIDFRVGADAEVCFQLTSPTNRPVLIGADRVEVTTPISLKTFGACSL